MTISVVPYASSMKIEWDDFISKAKNGHFLFMRDYMDYHSNRFEDCSLMIYDDNKSLLAVLPANILSHIVYSHQGLSFGGLILSYRINFNQVFEALKAITFYFNTCLQISSLIYKKMPDYYTSQPAHEDLYALFLVNAKLYRRDISSLIQLDYKLSYSKGRKWSIARAVKAGIKFSEEVSFKEFWQLLNDVLWLQHATRPVHSLDEIELLRAKFPGNIRCFLARQMDKILAGAVVYETATVAHFQYLANSEDGREVGALDALIDHLIKNIYRSKKYLDFGISTEDNGRTLNEGLIAYKEGFGARAFVHDFYEIKIT